MGWRVSKALTPENSVCCNRDEREWERLGDYKIDQLVVTRREQTVHCYEQLWDLSVGKKRMSTVTNKRWIESVINRAESAAKRDAFVRMSLCTVLHKCISPVVDTCKCYEHAHVLVLYSYVHVLYVLFVCAGQIENRKSFVTILNRIMKYCCYLCFFVQS